MPIHEAARAADQGVAEAYDGALGYRSAPTDVLLPGLCLLLSFGVLAGLFAFVSVTAPQPWIPLVTSYGPAQLVVFRVVTVGLALLFLALAIAYLPLLRGAAAASEITVTITPDSQIEFQHFFDKRTIPVADVTCIEFDPEPRDPTEEVFSPVRVRHPNTLVWFRSVDGPSVVEGAEGWSPAEEDREDFIAEILARNPAVEVRRPTADPATELVHDAVSKGDSMSEAIDSTAHPRRPSCVKRLLWSC